MKQFISPIVSFLLISLLALYVANFREGNYLPVWSFWFCIILILSLIVCQILKIKDQPLTYHSFILLQILTTALLIRMLFISTGNALTGYDAYNEFVTLSKVYDLGRWNPEIGGPGGYGAAYPMLYIFGMIWRQICGVELFTTAKWMPMSIFFVAPLFIYLIGKLKYSRQAGLLASFGFSFLYITLFFHSTFVKESIALPLFLIAIYSYYASIRRRKSVSYLLIAFLASAGCILAHHLTSFILWIFFATFLIVDRLALSKKDIEKRIVITSRYLIVNKEFISTAFVMLLFTALFGYWIYLRYTPLEFFSLIYKEASITNPKGGMILPNILRYKILYWGEIVFAILFAFLSICGVLLRKEKRNSSDVTLLLFGGLMGISMVLTLFGRVVPGEGMGLGSRFQTFVYVGLFILAGYTAHNVLKRHSGKFKNALPIIVLILFVSFALLSVYRIPPYLYSERSEFIFGEARPIIAEEEVTASIWLGLGREHNVVTDPSLIPSLLLSKGLKEKHGVISSEIRYIIHSRLTPTQTEEYIMKSQYKVYDNGIASVYFIPQ